MTGKCCLCVRRTPTCVEDGGSQRSRRSLVQDQFLHQHADGLPGKPPLQETHPEEIEVAMETERDQGDVARVAPVQAVPARKPLVDEVPSREQTAVQCNVGEPRKTTDTPQKRIPHYFTCCPTERPRTV